MVALSNLPAKAFLLLRLFRRAIGLLRFGPERLPSLKKMPQGLYDGCRARLGIASDLTIDFQHGERYLAT